MRLQDLDAAGVRQMVAPTARMMGTIAAADLHGTSGFGRFDASGVGPSPTWKDFLTSMGDPKRHDWQTAASRVDLTLVDRLLRTVATLAEPCPEERHLVHGDFGSYNVLADGSRITAAIDWDLALFGDPLYEAANLLFWHEQHLGPLTQHFEDEGHARCEGTNGLLPVENRLAGTV